MNETCIIFQKIDCWDLIRYMEQTTNLDFLHKNLSCREFLIFKLINDLNVDSKELIDTSQSDEGIQKLIQTFKFTTIQKWLKSLNINKRIDQIKNLSLVKIDSDRNIDDISPLQSLINLQLLFIGNNKISDISPLKNLTKLQQFGFFKNSVIDISPLQNLTNLRNLYLNGNKIFDVSPLKNLTNLEQLWLQWNQISDLSPLKNLKNLQYLRLHDNKISDVSPLKDLKNLKGLRLYNNKITDVSPLRDLIKLQNLHIDITVDDSSLQSLKKLQIFKI